jgi:hypothetical protein
MREANAFIETHHRHHGKVRGCKFCVAAVIDGTIHDVAIAGRPVARYLDDGVTAEVTRLCTDGTRKHRLVDLLFEFNGEGPAYIVKPAVDVLTAWHGDKRPLPVLDDAHVLHLKNIVKGNPRDILRVVLWRME